MNSHIRQHAGLWATPIALLLLAFVFRVSGLAKYDFWFDEASQAIASQSESVSQTLHVVSRDYGGAPLDHLITRATIRLVGDSEFALRFMPLCWSMLAVAVVWACGNALRPQLGKWAALCVAISPFAVRYAQELRFYSLGLLLGSVLLLMAILVARQRVRRSALVWVLTAAIAAATLYAHVYSFMLSIVGFAVIALASAARARFRALVWYACALLAGLAAFSPWLIGSLNTKPHPLGASAFGTGQLRLVLAGFEFTNAVGAPVAGLPAEGYTAAVLGLSLAAVLLSLVAIRCAPWLLGILAAIGMATVLVVGFNLAAHYFFHQRQFLFLLPGRAILLGAVLLGIETLASRLGRSSGWLVSAVLAAVLAVSSASFISRDLNRADFEKSRAASIAKHVAANFDPAWQTAWFAPRWVSRTVDYYLRRHSKTIKWNSFRSSMLDEYDLEALRQSAPGSIVVVSRGQMAIAGKLAETGFEMTFPPTDMLNNYDLVVFRKRHP